MTQPVLGHGAVWRILMRFVESCPQPLHCPDFGPRFCRKAAGQPHTSCFCTEHPLARAFRLLHRQTLAPLPYLTSVYWLAPRKISSFDVTPSDRSDHHCGEATNANPKVWHITLNALCEATDLCQRTDTSLWLVSRRQVRMT